MCVLGAMRCVIWRMEEGEGGVWPSQETSGTRSPEENEHHRELLHVEEGSRILGDIEPLLGL